MALIRWSSSTQIEILPRTGGFWAGSLDLYVLVFVATDAPYWFNHYRTSDTDGLATTNSHLNTPHAPILIIPIHIPPDPRSSTTFTESFDRR